MNMTLLSRVPTLTEQQENYKRKATKTISKIVIFAVCLIYAILLLFPFYTIFITSITNYEEIMSSMTFTWFPKTGATFDTYNDLLSNDPLANELPFGMPSLIWGFFNTIWIALTTVITGLFTSGLAAFAYAKLKFKGKNVLFTLTLIQIMIPTSTMTLPSFVFYNSIGWTGSFLPIVIPGLFGGATTIFFLQSYMLSIPTETVEAAKIDGLGPLMIFIRIILPQALPAFIAQFIFGFVGSYNNYMGPLLYLIGDTKMYTLQLALSELKTFFGHSNQKCAGAIIALLPLLIIYIIFQRFFIEGITVGGGKE